MKVAIFSAAEDGWERARARLPQNDAYYSAAYHRAHEFDGAQAFAFVAADGDRLLFHPVMLRPIRSVGAHAVPGGMTDIETVYGYTGPLASTTDASFLAASWDAYRSWCKESRAVSEFIRFHPLLGNHLLAAPQVRVMEDRETVIIHLDEGEDGLWTQYESVQRNRIRKAVGNHLGIEMLPVADELDEFIRLYRDTMRRLDALPFYDFPDGLFSAFAGELGETSRLGIVRHKGRIIASALFLLHDRTMHYHLGGHDWEQRNLGANNLLFHGAALWGARHGYVRLHMGGGRSNDPADPLLRFKRRLSPHYCRFRVGVHVLDGARFVALNALWREQFRGDREPAYFQLYRCPVSATMPVA